MNDVLTVVLWAALVANGLMIWMNIKASRNNDRAFRALKRYERFLKKRAESVQAAGRLIDPMAPGGILEQIARYAGPGMEVIVRSEEVEEGPMH